MGFFWLAPPGFIEPKQPLCGGEIHRCPLEIILSQATVAVKSACCNYFVGQLYTIFQLFGKKISFLELD